MPSQTWRAIRSALFEATFVVFGVVLALGANEWRESRAQRLQAQAALEEIVAELQANRAAVGQSLRYHQNVTDSLRSYQRLGGQPSIALFSRGFIFPAQVYRTAWTSASETGALAHMTYADVLRLSKAYALQEAYVEQRNSVGQVIYQDLYRGGSTAILANYQNLAGVISTFLFREHQLLEAYAETLAAVDPEAP
jgi:type II secretory pathway pseudopilin PulG